MITEDILKNLGFKYEMCPFQAKLVWSIGEEDVEFGGTISKLPIIYYNIEEQYCQCNRGTFNIIIRKCTNEVDILKFIECINFLFKLNITTNRIKTAQEILSNAIMDSYDKVKDNLDKPL